VTHHFSNYKIRIILGALVAAVAADGVITMYLVSEGLASESNPFLHFWVFEDTFLIVKLMGGLLAAFYLWNIYRRHQNLGICFSSIFLAGYIFIIYWNLHILLIS
jgi:H+/Cl- antiporter ClcA